MPEPQHCLSIVNEGEYLLATFPPYSGVLACTACLDEVFATLAQHGLSKVIIDHTKTAQPIPILECYELGNYMAGKTREQPTKIAIVASRGGVYPDRFFETVARNRQVQVSVFAEDFEAAQSWLDE